MKTLKKILSAVLLLAILQSLAFAQQRSKVVVLYGDKKTPETLYTGSYALVIGVSDYQSPEWADLKGVARDVLTVKTALEKQNFKVTLVTPRPTRAEILAAIQQFIDDYGIDYNSRLLIYFAGHGHTEVLPDGRNLGYIVPSDAR